MSVIFIVVSSISLLTFLWCICVWAQSYPVLLTRVSRNFHVDEQQWRAAPPFFIELWSHPLFSYCSDLMSRARLKNSCGPALCHHSATLYLISVISYLWCFTMCFIKCRIFFISQICQEILPGMDDDFLKSFFISLEMLIVSSFVLC